MDSISDLLTVLENPLIFSVIALLAVAAFALVYLRKPKGESVWLLERVKPGFIRLHQNAAYFGSTNKGEAKIKVGKNEYMIPEEKTDTFEDTVDDKGKHHKLWPLERGQITQFNGELQDAASVLLDHKTTSAAMGRTSAKRLAAPKLPKSDLYLYLIMGVVMGAAIGYILYPQFNHIAPVVEYFKVLPNGTAVPLNPSLR